MEEEIIDHWVNEFYDDHHGFKVFIGWKSIRKHPDPRLELSNSRFIFVLF